MSCANVGCNALLSDDYIHRSKKRAWHRFCMKCRLSSEPLRIYCKGCGKITDANRPNKKYCDSC